MGNIAVWYLIQLKGGGPEEYYRQSIFLTGVIALLVMYPAWYFYRRDRVQRVSGGLIPVPGKRTMHIKDAVLLVGMGAALAQFANIFMAFVQIFLKSTAYSDSMSRIVEGKSLAYIIVWMGIIAPIAEEMLFRWLIYLRLRDHMRMAGAAVISGVIFGIYHGNMTQAIYASILGIVFAAVLEWSGSLWSCVFLHIGANTWSLISSEYAAVILEKGGINILLLIYGVLLVIMVLALAYFSAGGKARAKRIV
ncbi:MAG: CPBP family intramembrane metalloprotease [Eubacteriales bacterium]|nr:CPBP family intramembrane metalloprotease [Eubacteriales bacterium]